LPEVAIPTFNISSPISSKREKELLFLDTLAAKSKVLAGILRIVDVMWFVYRHCKTYQAAVILLHGCPVVHDLDKLKNRKHKTKTTVSNKTRSKCSMKTCIENERHQATFQNKNKALVRDSHFNELLDENKADTKREKKKIYNAAEPF